MEKWPLLMSWRNILRKGTISVAWYHCDSSGLVIFTRSLIDAGLVWIDGWYGLLARLTCHMTDVC